MIEPFAGGAEPRIVYEDDEFLGVYKPCHLHSAPSSTGGTDLCSWLFAARPDLVFDSSRLRGPGAAGPREAGLFHRLDFETSGLILFAKAEEGLKALLKAQEASGIAKGYIALASPSQDELPGSLPPRSSPQGVDSPAWSRAIDAAMMTKEGLESLAGLLEGRELRCRFRPYGPRGARVACLEEGRPHPKAGPERPYSSRVLGARTQGQGKARGLSLELVIERGFRHQIRAQLAWLGLPIQGDTLYGASPGERLYLEARSLRLDLPGSSSPRMISLD